MRRVHRRQSKPSEIVSWVFSLRVSAGCLKRVPQTILLTDLWIPPPIRLPRCRFTSPPRSSCEVPRAHAGWSRDLGHLEHGWGWAYAGEASSTDRQRRLPGLVSRLKLTHSTDAVTNLRSTSISNRHQRPPAPQGLEPTRCPRSDALWDFSH